MATKRQGWAFILGAALMVTPSFGVLHAQSDQGTSAKQDMKQAGHNTKNAAKDAGRGTKKGTKKAWHKTKNTTKGAAHGAKQGAKQPSDPQ